MTIQDAAKSLAKDLLGRPWFSAVGVGERDGAPCIIVYATSSIGNAELSGLIAGWQGFPVEVKKLGKFRPLDRPLTA